MATHGIPKPGEIAAENIIRPAFDELSEEQRKAFEVLKTKRQEEIEVLRKKQEKDLEELLKKKEEEDQKAFLASFTKDRQGTITSTGQVRLTPLLDEASISTSLFSSDQLAAIDLRISDSNHQVYKAAVEYVDASKNTPGSQNANVIGLGSGPSVPPMNPLLSQNRQIIPNPPYIEPMRSIPYSAYQPDPTHPVVTTVAPVYSPTGVPAPNRSSANTEEGLEKFRAEIQKMMYENFGVEPKPIHMLYRKPYPDYFDMVPYPQGFRVPDFIKFNGVDNKTTWEHVSQYLAQLGEAGNSDPIKVRLFPLSLTGTAFSWFSALAPGSVLTWYYLEKKFHEHFYIGENELKLSHLTSVKQKHD